MESAEIGRLDVIADASEDASDEAFGDEFDADRDEEWFWDDATLSLRPPSGSGRTIVDELVDIFRKVTEFGCYCVIVSAQHSGAQGSPIYVQCIATPSGFDLEAPSNVFLWDTPEQLDDQQHALLEGLGWRAPTIPYDPAERPEDWNSSDETRNWWTPVGGEHAPERAATLLLQTLISVYRLPGEPELEARVFPASNQTCRWDPELGELVWGD